jgi:X-X-X-Leu-X-X-Gly heptad repeat protein
MPGADHQKIDEGVATLQKGLQELLSGVGKGEVKEG